jgi:uncharacterized protein
MITRHRRTLLGLAPAVAAVALLPVAGACGVGEESRARGADERASSGDASSPGAGPTGGLLSIDDLEEVSGGAPAARGADLGTPPGPVERTSLPGVGEVAIAITSADGRVSACCVMVAASAEQRERGLMEVTDLGGYEGMLFVWDADTTGPFYMRNTPTPLSIAWFDASGAFVSEADMEPCADVARCRLYPPAGPYRFALEVPQGNLAALGVGAGSRLSAGGSCAGNSS